MLKKAIALSLLLPILITLTLPANSMAGGNVTVTVNTPNSYLVIAGGGVVAAGITLGIISIFYNKAENESPKGAMYASLLTFDMDGNLQQTAFPQVYFDGETVRIPLAQWRF